MAKISEKKLLEAIVGSGGIVLTIAKKLSANWNTVRTAIDNNPAALQAWQNEREGILDLAESALMRSISLGDTQDAKWLLARLGKQRGYAERVEVDDVSDWRRKVIAGLLDKSILPETVKVNFDPATALALLAEAGVTVEQTE